MHKFISSSTTRENSRFQQLRPFSTQKTFAAKKYLTNQHWNREISRIGSLERPIYFSRFLPSLSFLSNRRFSTCQRFFLIINFQPDKQLIISRFAPISSATYSPFILHKSPSFLLFLLLNVYLSSCSQGFDLSRDLEILESRIIRSLRRLWLHPPDGNLLRDKPWMYGKIYRNNKI